MENVGNQLAPVFEPTLSPATFIRRAGGVAFTVARAIRRGIGHARGEYIEDYPELLHASDREIARFAARHGRYESPRSVMRDSLIGYR